MSSIISIEKLSVKLGSFRALQDVDLQLPAGRIVGFIGPSGAGKTTLIRTIVGRQRVSAGQVQIFAQPAGSAALRPRLRYMTQDTAIYADLTVRQNLRYFARMLNLFGKQSAQAVNLALKSVDMTDKADVMVADLSGGQKQRASLAVALLGDAELLVLDEPTVGLDPVLREQLWQLFRHLTEAGKTIIVSSHVMDEAERCDDLVLIRDGRVIAHAAPRALCEQQSVPSVEAAFLKLAGGNT